MNKDQVGMIDALIEVQKYMRTPSFTQDINGYNDLDYAFSLLVNCVHISLGQYQIKEYLNDRS